MRVVLTKHSMNGRQWNSPMLLRGTAIQRMSNPPETRFNSGTKKGGRSWVQDHTWRNKRGRPTYIGGEVKLRRGAPVLDINDEIFPSRSAVELACVGVGAVLPRTVFNFKTVPP